MMLFILQSGIIFVAAVSAASAESNHNYFQHYYPCFIGPTKIHPYNIHPPKWMPTNQCQQIQHQRTQHPGIAFSSNPKSQHLLPLSSATRIHNSYQLHHHHKRHSTADGIIRFPSQSSPSSSTAVSSTSSNIDEINASKSDNINKLDILLSKLTTGFPFFVILSAIVALVYPPALLWVNDGNIISNMLAAVMCGTGLTLNVSDFTNVIQDNLESIPIGVLCQFIIMPVAAYLVGSLLLLPISAVMTGGKVIGPELFLGLILVGCSPGGTASNLVSLIAGANVALSVLLTSCSTIMAVFMTPFLVKLSLSLMTMMQRRSTRLIGNIASSTTTSTLSASSPIQVSGLSLCAATAKVVLLPVLTGMILRGKFPKLADFVGRFTPFASVVLVSLICGGVVAQNTIMLSSVSSAAASGMTSSLLYILPTIAVSVLLLHTIGFAAGYMVPKFMCRQSEQTSRTISIEVGMQNSALAVVLARSIVGVHPIACLPGALSATAHSCLGSLLAALWRYQAVRQQIEP